ncbi:hypothetical protein [Halomicrobium salinisoli]|uniref:hypothetical protein n=1 Tax=Halomicrobium salinisoli TaxID=2878391 RepID=UPI001CF06720|nr:hypothetical protein [Halomicrobium salinisoli]
MRWPTVVVLVIVALVLAPMWVIASQGEGPVEEVELDHSVTEIRPLGGFVDTPNALSPSQVGVIVWVALFALYGVLAAAHRFMNAAVRPPDRGAAEVGETAAADGGEANEVSRSSSDRRSDGGVAASSWLRTDDRWIVEYSDASESVEGIVAMGGLTALAIVFAALFTGEYFTLARTQYFGVYAAGMFLSLAGLTVAYYAWFMPHVEVAERRGH